MIASLKGVLEELLVGDTACELIVDVGGVGYRVLVTNRTAAALGPLGTALSLKVHTHVREGALTLYGFENPAERQCFEILVATHGVGPALGLAVLGLHEPAALARIVASADHDALCLVPGVGRKTATRLVVELGQRLDAFAAMPAGGGAGGLATGVPTSPASGARTTVADALAGLGYVPEEVRGALAELPDEGNAEELLRLALVSLAPRR